jgi:hypothetical protein
MRYRELNFALFHCLEAEIALHLKSTVRSQTASDRHKLRNSFLHIEFLRLIFTTTHINAFVIHLETKEALRGHFVRPDMSYSNGYANGANAPRVIEVPLKEDPGSTLEIDCETLEEDTSELCEILNSEEVALKYWIKFAVLSLMLNTKCSLSIIDMGWWIMRLTCYKRAYIVRSLNLWLITSDCSTENRRVTSHISFSRFSIYA